MSRKTLLPALGFFSVVSILVSGCQIYRNPHGIQNTPPIIRLHTIPDQATLTVRKEALGGTIQLQTDCDLPAVIRPNDVIEVSKSGYLSWKGPIGDLPQIARGTYQLKLQPVVPAE